MSRSKRLRVVVKPAFHVLDANGQRVQVTGFTAEFMNGRFETNDEEQIAGMLKHRANGGQFHAVANESEWIDEHPEYFHAPADMVVGSVATVNTAPLLTASRRPLKLAAQTREQVQAAKEAQQVDLDTIIDQKLDAKLSPLYSRLDKLLNMAEVPQSEPAKEFHEVAAPTAVAKRTFTCPVPGCGFVGKSGIEIGSHKKEAHAG
jgi:hypothetical protein